VIFAVVSWEEVEEEGKTFGGKGGKKGGEEAMGRFLKKKKDLGGRKKRKRKKDRGNSVFCRPTAKKTTGGKGAKKNGKFSSYLLPNGKGKTEKKKKRHQTTVGQSLINPPQFVSKEVGETPREEEGGKDGPATGNSYTYTKSFAKKK